MTQNHSEPRVVILGWSIANLLGVAAAYALSFIPPLIPFHSGMLVSSLIIGLPIGFAQWMILRRVAPISFLWILTVPVALPTALAVLNSPIAGGIWEFLGGDESVLALTAGYLTLGLLVGLIQWLFLRPHFARSFVWMFSSAVGLGLGFGLILASNLIYFSGVISFLLVVLVYAIATGSVISWLRASNAKAGNLLVDVT
jgi:hypothetical protein